MHKYKKANWRDKIQYQVSLKDMMYCSSPVSLPTVVDLSLFDSPIRDQGQEGSCTGFASTGLFDYRQVQALRMKKYTIPEIYGDSFKESSPQFVYANERIFEDQFATDSGGSLRDIIHSLQSVGVCKEETWPYSPTTEFVRPSQGAYDEAAKHKVQVALKIPQSHFAMKACLAAGNPFIFGFDVYESFESPQVAHTGMMPMPGYNETFLGGHEVMCVGYNDSLSMYKIRNSWGIFWGLKGYFWMPYPYLENPNYASDLWMFTS